MASTNKCEYCGTTITSNDRICPSCGAGNPCYVVDTPKVILTPHTIEELKEYCAERGMPLLRMRFFVGEDFKEPRAFGVYHDEATGNYITYKNKDDGTRAIRYSGPSEEKAVSELYMKLLDECHKRGIYPDTPDMKPPKHVTTYKDKVASWSGRIWGIVIVIMLIAFFSRFSEVLISLIGGTFVTGVLLFVGLAFVSCFSRRADRFLQGKRGNMSTFFWIVVLGSIGIASLVTIYTYRHPSGYYRYNDTTYYSIGGDFYSYDSDSSDWVYSNDSFNRDYYVGDDYDSASTYDDWDLSWSDRFEDTYTYESYTDDSSDSAYDSWDSDSSWDSWDSGGSSWDSWDSGGSDWGSDW